jgi:type IX secretion system PorP/SprF family membrane protein
MKFFTILIICLFTLQLHGQELPIFNEYHLNKTFINPAIIGSEPCTHIKATDRHQWIGVKNAPVIQTLSFETSLYNKKAIRETDKKISGLGGYIFRDRNGDYQTLGIQASYAFHVYLSKASDIKMGLGLSAGFFQATLDESGFVSDDATLYDPIITGTTNSEYIPDITAGIFIYSSKSFIGLSGTHFLTSVYGTTYYASPGRNYFLIAGFLTGAESDKVRILPSITVKATEDLKKQADLNLKLLFADVWWAGISYRHNFDELPGISTAILPVVGMNIRNMSVGYAFEYTPGQIRKNTYGTHELILSWHFCGDGFRCPVYR